MAKIKNISGEDLTVPSLGGRFVKAGQVVEVPDGDAYGFTQQVEVWAASDADAEQAHDAGHQAYIERRSEELGAPVDDEGNRLPPQELEEPGGNASRDEWVAYVTGAQLATLEDLEGKGRDEIRDAYRTPDPDQVDPDAGTPASGDADPDPDTDTEPGDGNDTDGSN